MPPPDPDDPLVMVIHEAPVEAVHEHPDGAVTETFPVAASDEIELVVGVTAKLQVAPACVTVTVCPAMVTVPVRAEPEVFSAIDSVTVPEPVPLVPPVTVIHDALLTAVHAHPVPAVTPTLPVDVADVTDRLVVDNVNAQTGAACDTVKVRPATVIVPVRDVGPGLAVALKLMVVLPLPLVALVTVSHDALLDAVQPHPAPAVSANEPVVADALIDILDGDRL